MKKQKISGNTDSDQFRDSGCEAWPGKPGDCGGTLSDRRQRGIFGFCCAYFFEWIYVWKSGFYHVQSGRRSVEPGSDAYSEINR